MNAPLVSVIVPVYNAEKYLRRCIESILNQDYRNLELILINDGSRDNSLQICREYASSDPRVTVIDKPNGGVSSARNAGINIAKGTYITFVDADDFVSETYLSDFRASDDCDIYVQGYTREIPGKSPRINANVYELSFDFAELINMLFYSNMILMSWGKLFKTSIVHTNKILFHEGISYGEDRIFNVEYLSNCKTFKVAKKHGYHYTFENPVALTRIRHSAKSLLEYVQLLRPLFLNLLNKYTLDPKVSASANLLYNYDLILSVVSAAESDELSRKERRQFYDSINREMIEDASSQDRLPLYFKIAASLLKLKYPVRDYLLQLLVFIYKNKK